MKVRGRETGSFKSFWELPFQFEQFVIFLLIGVKQHKLTQLFGSLLELSRVLGSDGSGTTAKGIGRKIKFYQSWWFFKSFAVPPVLSILKNHQIFMPKQNGWDEEIYLPKSHFSTILFQHSRNKVRFAKFSQRIETGMIDLKQEMPMENQIE